MDTTTPRTWIKSSYSGPDSNCLEYLTPPPQGRACVRDSKGPDHVVINFRAGAWAGFLRAIRHGKALEPGQVSA